MIRIAHLADLHLGAALADVPVASPLGALAAEAPFAAFERVVQLVGDGGYDAVLVAGDVFDRGDVPERALTVFETALERWHEAGLRIVIIGGNHDAESPLPARVALPASVRWLAADAAETVVWDDLGIAVHGQSIRERDDLRDLAAGYPAPPPGLRSIGMLHTSLDGGRSRRDCAPTTPATLAARGYDYWALGHVHRRGAVDEAGRIAYAGSIYGRRPDETGAHGFLAVELSDAGVGLTPVDSSVLRFETVALAAALPIEDQITARFAALADEYVVWTLAGTVTADAHELARELAARNERHLVLPATR